MWSSFLLGCGSGLAWIVGVALRGSRQLRPAARPRTRGLQLGAEREQRGLVGRAAEEVDADWQAVLAVRERQRDRRLAGDVRDRAVGRELAGAAERLGRVVVVAEQLADRTRPQRER